MYLINCLVRGRSQHWCISTERTEGVGGHDASVLFFKCWSFVNAATWRLWLRECSATWWIVAELLLFTRRHLGNALTYNASFLLWFKLLSTAILFGHTRSIPIDLRQRVVNELAQHSKAAGWVSNPGPLDWETPNSNSVLTRLTQPPRPHLPSSSSMRPSPSWPLIEMVKMLMNYCLHRPTVVHTYPAGVYHHFIFTYFRVFQVKLGCRLTVSRAQDEWRASNLLQDIKYYRLHVTVYICGDLYMDRLWVHRLDTPENNQHLNVLIWGGGGSKN